MPDLMTVLLAELDRRQQVLDRTSEAPWFYNSYSAIFSSPMVKRYDPWLDARLEEGHSLEHREQCDACDAPSCRLFIEDYRDWDPLIAHVPASAGDLASGRHQADAKHMEIHDPADACRRYAAYRRILARHCPTETADWPSRLGDPPIYCDACTQNWPCADVLDVAASLGLDPDAAPAEPTERRCSRCGGENPDWVTPSPVWNAVMRQKYVDGGKELFNGFVCPNCFIHLATAFNVAGEWRLFPMETFKELYFKLPDGRVWDSQSWLWRPAEDIEADLTKVAAEFPANPHTQGGGVVP